MTDYQQKPISQDDIENEIFREKQMKIFTAKKTQNLKLNEEEEESVVDEEIVMMEETKARLKGKNYTYDQNGNIIIINAANPEKLPSYQLNLSIDVQEPETEQPKRRPRNSRAKKASGVAKNGKSKANPHFKKALEVQPPIIETMQVINYSCSNPCSAFHLAM